MNEIQVKAIIDKANLDDLNHIKEYFGLKSYSEAVRMCITLSQESLHLHTEATRLTAEDHPNNH